MTTSLEFLEINPSPGVFSMCALYFTAIHDAFVLINFVFMSVSK